MKKIIFAVILLVLIAVGGMYYYINLDFRDGIVNKKPDFEISAAELFEQFSHDETAANDLYLGKVLSISGSVEEIQLNNSAGTVTLMTNDPIGKVVCELNQTLIPENVSINPGDQIEIKGECSGMLMDIIIVNSVITIP